jgi:hypothetical protein
MEDRYHAIRAAGLAPTATMLVVKAVCGDEVRRIPILNKARARCRWLARVLANSVRGGHVRTGADL